MKNIATEREWIETPWSAVRYKHTMSSQVEIGSPPCPPLLHANKTDHRFLGIFLFLSFFELPIVWIGTDALGLYDVFLLFFAFYLMLRTRGFSSQMPWQWRMYFLAFFGYIIYLFFQLGQLADFRAGAILFKTIETLLVMYLLYTLFANFDFEPRRLMSMIEIDLVLLTGFQLFSFVNTFHPFIGIPPGFGIGEWYRISLPFMQGVSPDPAGFTAGTFIFLNIFARNRRDVGRARFVFVMALLAVCLLLTVSRTNILVAAAMLVIYLFRRAFTKSRYIIVVGLFAGFLVVLVNVLVDRLPQNSHLWLLLNLVEHPSSFFSQVDRDASFAIRYTILWPDQIDAWLTSTATFLFGNGISYFPIADGTYTGLLANQGVVGLLLFLYVWYVHFLVVWRSKLPFLWILLLYALLNGITGDTLVTSYRSIQPYVVALFFVIFAYGGFQRQVE